MPSSRNNDHDPAQEDAEDAAGSDAGAMTVSDAQAALYALFHQGKAAYTHKGHVYHRYYCLACLHNEIAAVRAAREQFGMAQGREASIEVLTGIATGRLPYFLPRIDQLLNHLCNECSNITSAVRSRSRKLQSVLNRAGEDVCKNPYDLGTVFEVTRNAEVQSKKRKLDDLMPGSASPAKLFQAHEAKLLDSAKQREDRSRKTRRDKLQQEREVGQSTTETTPIPDFFEEETTVEQEAEALLAVIDGEGRKTELPDDFPCSVLLESLEKHASALYSARGLMQATATPKDAKGNRVPSMISSLNGSALIALGILTQELVRSRSLPMRETDRQEAESNLFVRNVASDNLEGHAKSRRQRQRERAILECLKYGEQVGTSEIWEALGRDKVDASSSEKHE